ncbi:MAG: glycosyltransferase family 39 protein [Candidatus Daviesbacteria bacterium]|nr:glycosyltransferase family 39 protein [Candidatus Daviesbacteria bacterium]
MNKNHFILLLLIIFAAFFIRVTNLTFPAFTSDEARVAFRGYTLATTAKDELGRVMPILFNSSGDYQLPAVSYITALGTLVFGKTDLGARMPFILISILIVVLIYKISDIFFLKKEFRLLAALVAAFTPSLIFFSKIPNETIVFTFSLILLFYLLTKEKINFLSVVFTVIFSIAVSKIAWWILIPFTVLTLTFFQPNLRKRTKISVILIVLFLTTVAVVLFLRVPQATRSFLENDFLLLQENSITVAMNRSRGQGLESHWPNFVEKILFNKLQFIAVGVLNWLSHLDLAVFFGQFDEEGKMGFSSMGAFPKIAIFPFIVGIIALIRKSDVKLRALLFYPLVLTFPLVFVYPRNRQDIAVIVLPFLIFIIALGLIKLNRLLKIAVLSLMIFEVIINMFFVSPQIKQTNYSRPAWVKQIVEDGYNLSVNSKVALSDDFTSDIAPFLEWYTPLVAKDDFKNIQFPYKFHQSQVSGIKIIGNDDTFYFCGLDKSTHIFASKRDLEEIQKWLNVTAEKTVVKTYKDDLGNNIVYLLRSTICVK